MTRPGVAGHCLQQTVASTQTRGIPLRSDNRRRVDTHYVLDPTGYASADLAMLVATDFARQWGPPGDGPHRYRRHSLGVTVAISNATTVTMP